MNLLDIPKEILAKLLVLLSVRDLLTLELVSRRQIIKDASVTE